MSTSTNTTIATIAAVVGGLTLVGSAVGVGVSSATAMSADSADSVSVEGVTALDIDASGADVSVVWADVDEAVLETSGSHGGWTLTRDRGELRVDRAGSFLRGWWFGDDDGWSGWDRGDEVVVVTLPESLRDAGLDAEFSLGGGALTASGSFGDLDLDVSAGALEFRGAARELDLSLSAGQAEIEVADVREADLDVAAGWVDARLTGEAPSSVGLSVSAGEVDLQLPKTAYALETETVAGSLDNRLEVSPSSRHEVSVELTAGSVILR